MLLMVMVVVIVVVVAVMVAVMVVMVMVAPVVVFQHIIISYLQVPHSSDKIPSCLTENLFHCLVSNLLVYVPRSLSETTRGILGFYWK